MEMLDYENHKKSFKVSNGTHFNASLNTANRLVPFQGCQNACVAISNQVGGNIPFVTANIAFIRSCRFRVHNRWGGHVYTSPWHNSDMNETVALWDGCGVTPNATYHINIHNENNKLSKKFVKEQYGVIDQLEIIVLSEESLEILMARE